MIKFKGFSIDHMIARSAITDADVMKLRAATYADGRISPEEAEALFALNDAAKTSTRAWNNYFIEAITDFLVNQAEPMGYVTVENAHWLMDRVDHDGHVDTRTELELVINVIDRARWAPEALVRFALVQVRDCVISGTGVLRSGAELVTGEIAEAEVLFDINDAVSGGTPNAAWTDLFVKAIANAVMSVSSYAVPAREEALRRDAWLDYHTDLSPMGLIKKYANGGSSLRQGYRLLTREESTLDRLERQRIEMVVNETVTEVEATWLTERICRDGDVNDDESALLAFLKAESPEIHPALKDLIERHAPVV
jgi:hypothetical protein